MENIFYITMSLVFGSIFGSFITATSYRLPRNESMWTRSHCPICNKKLKARSLIPIFSWLLQGGKCLNCGTKISLRYPLTEIITAILFLSSYLKFGYNFNTILVDVFIVICMIMIITDLETYTIPDSTQLALLFTSLIFIFYNNFDPLYSVFSAIIYFLLIFICGLIVEYWKKKDAIGGGDIKLITICGLVLGIGK